jgi:two-component system OmpR family sensor kinase
MSVPPTTPPDASDSIARVLDERDSMLRLVAHDIRAPLGVISGAIAEIGHPSMAELNDEQKMLLSLVKRSCDRLARLATNLSFVSRVQSGTLVVTKTSLDAGALLQHVVKTFRETDDVGGATLTVEAPEGMSLSGDRESLTVALQNLLANAVRFAQKRVLLRVDRVEAPDASGGTFVHLIVEDDGPGFPAGGGDVFDRLHRSTRSQQSGSGLGLGIVRGVARAHGGRATAENLRDAQAGTVRGAQVSLELPV